MRPYSSAYHSILRSVKGQHHCAAKECIPPLLRTGSTVPLPTRSVVLVILATCRALAAVLAGDIKQRSEVRFFQSHYKCVQLTLLICCSSMFNALVCICSVVQILQVALVKQIKRHTPL
jgi:hypothetical protein